MAAERDLVLKLHDGDRRRARLSACDSARKLRLVALSFASASRNPVSSRSPPR